jgi:isopentenyl phosphate kinase
VTPELVLVKLGGSLITDKQAFEVARTDVVGRLAAELRQARAAGGPQVVLAHGSGSFGHAAAADTPLAERGRRDRGTDVEGLARAAARTQDAAARLHRALVSALLDAEIPAFSLAPSSFLWRSGGMLRGSGVEPLLGALGLGLVPVGYGDVVMDQDAGAAICSTEALLATWVDALVAAGRTVRCVLWLGGTAGVLDEEGRTIPRITEHEIDSARALAGASGGVDVTGGMRLRVDTAWSLARKGVPSWIVDGRDAGGLTDALLGAPRGTEVRSGR